MFQEYLLTATKKYNIQLRSLVEFTDDMMDKLEKIIFKYRPESVSEPKRLMFHSNPLGFVDVVAKEVWVVDIVLTVPIAPHIVEFEIRTGIGQGKSDGRFVVLNSADVRDEDKDIEEEIVDEPISILRNKDFEEVEEANFTDYYGDDYNSRFVSFLKEYEIERKEKAKAGTIDPEHPIAKASEHKHEDSSEQVQDDQ